MELHQQTRLSSAGLEARLDLTFNPGGRASSTGVVQQQDYLSSVWLSKKDKLEH
ncbi:inactive phospholipase D5 isoform X1, partial [Clarias magur]